MVLSNISFCIKPGQTVGIIGQTGAAKTTLVQLIPRLYEAEKGRITIDGIPVEEYPMEHLRDAIAMVLQKNTLFSGTLLSNLKWGNENAGQEEVELACHIACADEFIDRLPQGYETEMGQGGVNVSGGQKQRLCIAQSPAEKTKGSDPGRFYQRGGYRYRGTYPGAYEKISAGHDKDHHCPEDLFRSGMQIRSLSWTTGKSMI